MLFSILLIIYSVSSLIAYVSYSTELEQTINYCDLEISNYEYNGFTVKPSAIIINAVGDKLEEGIDYKFEYDDMIRDVGTYNVNIVFKGRYSCNDSVEKEITVRPKQTFIKLLSSEANRITVSYETTNHIDGYEIEYSSHENFEPVVTSSVSIVNPNIDTETINHLRFNTKYYFRIRTYATVGDRNIYSYWSNSSSANTQTTKWQDKSAVDGYSFLVKNTDEECEEIIPCKARIDENSNCLINISSDSDNQDWYYVDYYICYRELISQRFNSFSLYYNSTGGLYIDNDSKEMINEYYSLVFESYNKIGITDTMSTFDKYLNICEWVNHNISYAYDNQTNHHFYAINGLKDGETVCGGYAAIIKDLCTLANIPCEIIHSDSHAWYVVNIDGKWYTDEFGSAYNNLKYYYDNDIDNYDLKENIFFSPYSSSNYSEVNDVTEEYQFILDYKI